MNKDKFLFKVSLPEELIYPGQFDSFVCIANNEAEARKMYPDDGYKWSETEECWYNKYSMVFPKKQPTGTPWPITPNEAIVQCIAKITQYTGNNGPILASFIDK